MKCYMKKNGIDIQLYVPIVQIALVDNSITNLFLFIEYEHEVSKLFENYTTTKSFLFRIKNSWNGYTNFIISRI